MACQIAAVLSDRDLLRGRDAPADVRARLGALWSLGDGGADGWSLGARAAEPTPAAPPSTRKPRSIRPRPSACRSGPSCPRGRIRGENLRVRRRAADRRVGECRLRQRRRGPRRPRRVPAHPPRPPSAALARRTAGTAGSRLTETPRGEAGKVVSQLLNAVKVLAGGRRRRMVRAGVGGGDPRDRAGTFLGEGENEAGVLLAMAYPTASA